MEEVIFRAWEKNLKEMIPVYDIDFKNGIINKDSAWRFFNEIILMQYTGIKDGNGAEIYEGDIVRSVALSNDHNQRGAITVSPVEYWNGNACLSITYVPIYPFCLTHDIKKIGNIYENPELLK